MKHRGNLVLDGGLSAVCQTVLAGWGNRKSKTRPSFVLDGAKVTSQELGDPLCMLPVFAWHADNLYRYSVRARGIGFEFHASSEAVLERTVDLDKTDRSATEVLLFLLEAVEDAYQHLPKCTSTFEAAELRTLVNRFAAEMKEQEAAQQLQRLAPDLRPGAERRPLA